MLLEELCSGLRSVLQGEVLANEPMRKHTTFRIGGPADLFVVPARDEDLKAALSFAREHSLPIFVLGGGANILVADEGIEGIVIHLSSPYFCRREFRETSVVVGCGAKTQIVLNEAIEREMAGLEFLAAVPGTIGGALIMNAGTYMGEIGRVTEWVRVLTDHLQTLSLSARDLNFQYRKSSFQEGWILLNASLQIRKGSRKEIETKVNEILTRRKEAQPLGVPSAGSVFKNPQGKQAWALIDQIGARGKRIGGAMISEKHSNFIVNQGDARARDVLELIRHAQKEVQAQLGIALETEVKLVGRW